jgi:hypothetical protein
MSVKKSLYQKAILESIDRSRTIDITQGIILFEYYEDVFSPTITAKIKIVNNGNVIAPSNGGSQRQSIYNGLPLRGGERLSLKIAGNSSTNPGLDFSKKVDDYFYVSAITDVISETNRESFTLNLVSREAITNETSRVYEKFPSDFKINQSVSKILKDYLKTNKIGKIDISSNKYGFIGNSRKPFTVLIWLASKAVFSKSAGFLFYQTKDGFQFRSIDELIKQPVKATYTYTEAQVSYDENAKKVNNDFKILNYYTDKNQNLLENLRLGAYSSDCLFFNPLDGKLKKPEYNIDNYSGAKSTSLGSPVSKKKILPPLSDNSPKNLGDVPTRIITAVLDVGTMEKGVSKKLNADPTEYQSQTLRRYNTLMTQVLNVVVPSNTNLRAGDVIQCNFPKISQGSVSEFDRETSGLYMIKELCHHFDVERSYTSLKLVRDTFGQRK